VKKIKKREASSKQLEAKHPPGVGDFLSAGEPICEKTGVATAAVVRVSIGRGELNLCQDYIIFIRFRREKILRTGNETVTCTKLPRENGPKQLKKSKAFYRGKEKSL